MPSPLCLDGAAAHIWISDPNSERCHLQLGQGGGALCKGLCEGRGIPLTSSHAGAKAKGAQGHQGVLVLSWK